MIVARPVLGQRKQAARRAGSRLRPTSVSSLVLSGQPHVVWAALTALRSLPSRAGPVALRDMDALCIKGLEQDVTHNQSATGAETSRKTQDGYHSSEPQVSYAASGTSPGSGGRFRAALVTGGRSSYVS